MMLAALLHCQRVPALFPTRSSSGHGALDREDSYAGFQAIGKLPRDPFGFAKHDDMDLQAAELDMWHAQCAAGALDAHAMHTIQRVADSLEEVRLEFLSVDAPA